MLQRLSVALTLGVMASFALAGVGEAAKGPDATDVAVGTVIVVAVMMALLLLIYGIKVAFGGDQALPAEDLPAGGEHH